MSSPSGPTGDDPGVTLPHQRVGWFELFYDLVIVAAVGYAAHTFAHHPSWSLGFWIAAWTLIMFVLWLLTTLNNNLYPGDRAWRRMLGLAQMLALVIAALGTVADEGLSNSVGFAGLTVAFGSVTITYVLAMRDRQIDRRDVRVLAWASGAATVILATGILLPDDASWGPHGWPPRIIAVGMAAAAIPLFYVAGRLAGRIDEEHMGERLGQLVIIVLGESFMSLVSALGGLPSIPNPLFFVLTFLVVFAIWTLYFSSVLPAGMPRSSGRLRSWLLTHWLLMFGAVGAAAGFSAVTLDPIGEVSPNAAAQWTTAPLCFVMIALGLLTWLGRDALTLLVRVHFAAAGALLVLAVVGELVPAEGMNWEIGLGSLVVIADAAFVARKVRPYRSAAMAH